MLLTSLRGLSISVYKSNVTISNCKPPTLAGYKHTLLMNVLYIV